MGKAKKKHRSPDITPAPEVSEDKASPEKERLVGHQVIIRGLVGRPELNGQTGFAESLIEATGRMAVRIGDEKISLRPENLVLEDVASQQPPGAPKPKQSEGKPLREIFLQFCESGKNIEDMNLPSQMGDEHWTLLIMTTMKRYRRIHATNYVQMCAWRACERLLLVCERVHGPTSPEVAGILLHQCNVYLDLNQSQRISRQYGDRCIEQAQRLQQLAQAPWLANGAKFDLPFWEEDEAYTSSTLQIEALGHMGGAHFDLHDPATAELCYEQALSMAEAAGLADSESASRIHNCAASLFQSLAAPSFSPKAIQMARKRGQRQTKANGESSKSPKFFDEEAVINLNKALRHACCFLRYSERRYGLVHEQTGGALQAVADVCFVARLREPAVRHCESAVRVFTAVFGRDHPRTESAQGLLNTMSNSTTEAIAGTLEDDVKLSLSRHGREVCCARTGCSQTESESRRFQSCARWCAALFPALPNKPKLSIHRVAVARCTIAAASARSATGRFISTSVS